MKERVYKDVYPGQIHFEKKNHIAYLKFDNPKNLNALSYSMFASINEIFDTMSGDRDILGVILTGEGRSFIVGADLKELDKMKAEGDYDYFFLESYRDARVYIHDTMNKIVNFDRPTLCAVNGYALGGGAEVAMCCDIRIMSSKAKVGFPECGIGGIPAYTGVSRALRILGIAVTKEMMMTARHYTAEEALQRGFTSEVCEPEKLMDRATEMMSLIVSRAPVCEKYLKLFLNNSAEMSYQASLEYERNMVAITQATEDAIEGSKAFIEKRPPQWKNG